jgi:hypothetical protein
MRASARHFSKARSNKTVFSAALPTLTQPIREGGPQPDHDQGGWLLLMQMIK